MHMNTPQKFKLGDLVRKTKGSQWSGTVVGTYSTELTPEGYAVESGTEKGSVQIYPAGALERAAAATESLQAEVERLRKASVPVCVGRPLIQILAAEGQWVSEDGQGLIAADGLFRKDPYIELEKLRAEALPVSLVEAASRPAGSVSTIHQCDAQACCNQIATLQRKVEAVSVLLTAVRVASCLGAYTDDYVRQEANAALDEWNKANK